MLGKGPFVNVVYILKQIHWSVTTTGSVMEYNKDRNEGLTNGKSGMPVNHIFKPKQNYVGEFDWLLS